MQKKCIAKKTYSEINNKSSDSSSEKPLNRYPRPIIVTPEIEKSFGKPIAKEKLDEYLEKLEEARKTMSVY